MFKSLAKFITRNNLTAAKALKIDNLKKKRNFAEKISYFFALIFSVKNDYYHEKIIARSKFDPTYPSRFWKIRRRYERRKKPIKRQQQMDLAQSYTIFSYVLIAHYCASTNRLTLLRHNEKLLAAPLAASLTPHSQRTSPLELQSVVTCSSFY